MMILSWVFSHLTHSSFRQYLYFPRLYPTLLLATPLSPYIFTLYNVIRLLEVASNTYFLCFLPPSGKVQFCWIGNTLRFQHPYYQYGTNLYYLHIDNFSDNCYLFLFYNQLILILSSFHFWSLYKAQVELYSPCSDMRYHSFHCCQFLIPADATFIHIHPSSFQNQSTTVFCHGSFQ